MSGNDTAANVSISVPEIVQLLTDRIDQLVRELLPGGIREGRQWRAGSVAGEAGASLVLELAGPKRGLFVDHANPDHRGDALDLVRLSLNISTAEAIAWAKCWLGIAPGEARAPSRPISAPTPAQPDKPPTWPQIWRNARPIACTLAETYLTRRGLAYADPDGLVLRFAVRRARRSPDDALEHHPAMLALLRNVLTGEPCGIVNVFLLPDGRDRLRDRKGKTSTGKAGGAAVMLGDFADVTYGLTICEGPETAIKVDMDGQSPVWALGGAGNLAAFPVLPGIEALTVAADTGTAGQAAAREVAARWREAGREVRTITPLDDDWANEARSAAQ